ncbi:TOM1-like protein 2 [Cajanus cajan]|uniref:TOM1-like protein 2 n=1 Tax=Cajanus cajan TaxID=3821 RepID=UPI00098D9AC6|nr:TOM1-like protein 2 [Cajanus cajan]
MERLKLAQLGERLKTGGAQMGRMVSGKVKEMLQAPTPESKMVEDATAETLQEPNWGMNLRICAMINSDDFSGSELVKALKRRLTHKSPLVQTLTLELLETCAMNCDKLFSEIASEKLLDDLVRLMDNPQAQHHTRRRAFHLIRAWGESQDLAYLPVFRQTYMSLKGRDEALDMAGGNSPSAPYTLESDTNQYPVDPPERYPIPQAELYEMDDSATFSTNYLHMSIEEKKEHLVVARNSLELLSSILNSEAEPKPLKEDITVSLLDKCKQSLSVIKGIVEGTTDDEATLFEALYLNDELQQVVSKYEELEAAQSSGAPPSQNADTAKHDAELVQNRNELPESDESEAAQNLDGKLPQKFNTLEVNATEVAGLAETKVVDDTKEKGAESSFKQDTK